MPSFSLPLSVVALAASLLSGCKSSSPASEQQASTVRADSTHAAPPADTAFLRLADQGRVEGSASAPVWMIIASDFQCPYCRIWHDSTYATLVRDYVQPGKVRLAYINFPLPMHPNAVPAAEAAMCASAQGKFWEMHSALFVAQETWSSQSDARPTFEGLAQKVGVDVPAWKRCMDAHTTMPLVQVDVERTRQSGVKSTPSFMILRGNTVVKAIAGAQPTADFRAALDEALAAAGTR